MVVFGIGGNGMGGARCMREGACGYRWHIEGGHQLLKGPVARAVRFENVKISSSVLAGDAFCPKPRPLAKK
jgi:hypothetical protein